MCHMPSNAQVNYDMKVARMFRPLLRQQRNADGISSLEFNNLFPYNLLGIINETNSGIFRGQLDGGSRVVVYRFTWARTNNDRAWFAKIVPCVSRPDNTYRMEMTTEHQMRLDVLAQELAPFTIDVQFNIEWLVVNVHERNVAND